MNIITFSSTDSSLSGEAKLAQLTELYGALQYLPLIEELGVVFNFPTESSPEEETMMIEVPLSFENKKETILWSVWPFPAPLF